ncbi:MAG: hypothetical protein AAGI49_20210 [Bacteroidota bacterium]
MKKALLLGITVLWFTNLSFGQQGELLETIEVHAYIQQDQLPQYAPVGCPALEEKVEDDILAERVISTLMYELINFWGEETVEGAEGGFNDRDAVFWKIIKSNQEDFEVILKTEDIKLGKKVYAQLEEQQVQTCFNWGLVFSNEEVTVMEEDETEALVIAEDFDAPTAYERYDPYQADYIRNAANAPNTDEFNDNEAPESVAYDTYSDPFLEYDIPDSNMALGEAETTSPDSYDTESYGRTDNYNAASAAFSAMMPAPSSEIVLPLDFFTSIETLGEVERLLTNALDARGYTNKGYFEFDNGFMIATQLEAINSNDTPKAAQYRWPSRVVFNQSLSFSNYMSSLFLPDRSKYRMFVFYVEAAPDRIYSDFDEIDYSVSSRTNVNDGRRSRLPNEIAQLPYRHKNNMDSNVKVLVYESQTGANERKPRLLAANTSSAREHLMKAGLWSLFERR